MSEKLESDEKAIISVFNQFNRAIEQMDYEKILSLYDKDEQVFTYGTASNEVYQGWTGVFEGYKKLMDQSLNISMTREFKIRNLQILNNIAWYAKDTTIKVIYLDNTRLDSQHTIRSTGVLKNTANGWKILQRHVSTPEAGIEEGGGWPTIKGIESEIAKWITDFKLNPHFNNYVQRSELLNYLTKAQEIIRISR
jgi:ketosteroid isomerase-like protein